MALLNCNFCSSVLGKNVLLTVILPERRHQPRIESFLSCMHSMDLGKIIQTGKEMEPSSICLERRM